MNEMLALMRAIAATKAIDPRGVSVTAPDAKNIIIRCNSTDNQGRMIGRQGACINALKAIGRTHKINVLLDDVTPTATGDESPATIEKIAALTALLYDGTTVETDLEDASNAFVVFNGPDIGELAVLALSALFRSLGKRVNKEIAVLWNED